MISFVLPSYNEEENIKATVETINDSVKRVKFIDKFEIVIVNDGSTDLTEKVVFTLKKDFNNITYCKNLKNLGVGPSILKGLEQVKYPKFMLLPGDNDIPTEAIVSAIKHLNSADLIIPFPINAEDRPRLRRILSKLYVLIYLIFFNTCINYINGPSILPTERVRSLKSRTGLQAEIITKLLCSDITFCEVPVFFKFSQRERGRKSISIKVLYDVFFSFIKLYIEIKFKKKKQFLDKAKRKILYL